MQVPPMRPLSTTAVLKPCETAADAIIIPEPEPITKTSNRSTTISTTNKIKQKTPNKLFKAWVFTIIFITISAINSLRLVMSKQKKAEDEKKKKAYYSKSEKKAKEVKK
jgi:hypothetical protein